MQRVLVDAFNNKHLSGFLQSDEVVFCIKDASYRVLYQNEPCLKLCQKQSGQICKKNCMSLYVRPKEDPTIDREKGTQYYPAQLIEGNLYDIFLLNDGKYLITIVYPLEDRHQADMEYYSKYDLTRRETEILSLKLTGLSNKEISKKLFISLGTLKTHLNHIYQKIPPQALETDHIS